MNVGAGTGVRLASWQRVALSVVLMAAVAGIGSASTAPRIAGWYAGLAKPAWTPPDWVFPIAWTLLYALMAVALYRMWSLPPGTAGRRRALFLFLGQLALNAAWSPVFFGLEAPWAGLAVIVLLVLVLLAAARAAFRVDTVAGWLLVPYVLWVCYASALNAAIAVLN